MTRRTALKIRATRGKSFSRAEPALLVVIFGHILGPFLVHKKVPQPREEYLNDLDNLQFLAGFGQGLSVNFSQRHYWPFHSERLVMPQLLHSDVAQPRT